VVPRDAICFCNGEFRSGFLGFFSLKTLITPSAPILKGKGKDKHEGLERVKKHA